MTRTSFWSNLLETSGSGVGRGESCSAVTRPPVTTTHPSPPPPTISTTHPPPPPTISTAAANITDNDAVMEKGETIITTTTTLGIGKREKTSTTEPPLLQSVGHLSDVEDTEMPIPPSFASPSSSHRRLSTGGIITKGQSQSSFPSAIGGDGKPGVNDDNMNALPSSSPSTAHNSSNPSISHEGSAATTTTTTSIAGRDGQGDVIMHDESSIDSSTTTSTSTGASTSLLHHEENVHHEHHTPHLSSITTDSDTLLDHHPDHLVRPQTPNKLKGSMNTVAITPPAESHQNGIMEPVSQCLLCSAHFYSDGDVQIHHDTCHAQERPTWQIPCPHCNMGISSWDGLKTHMKVNQGAPCQSFFPPPTPKWADDVELRAERYEESYSFKVWKRNDSILSCFPGRSSLIYCCDICSRPFKDRVFLQRHKVIHDGDDHPFRCFDCGLHFDDLGQMEAHTVCGKGKYVLFSLESDLASMIDHNLVQDQNDYWNSVASYNNGYDYPMPCPEAADAAAAAAKRAIELSKIPPSYISIPTYIYDSNLKSLAPHLPVVVCPESIGKHFPGFEYNASYKGLVTVGSWNRVTQPSGPDISHFPAYLYDAASARVMPYIYELASKSLMPVQNVASISTAAFIQPSSGLAAPDIAALEKAIMHDVLSQPLQCCSRAFSGWSSYRAHIAQHNMEPQPSNSYRCTSCEDWFISARDLMRHGLLHHPAKTCDTTAASLNVVAPSLATPPLTPTAAPPVYFDNLVTSANLPPSTGEDVNGRWACNQCDRSFSRKEFLVLHASLHPASYDAAEPSAAPDGVSSPTLESASSEYGTSDPAAVLDKIASQLTVVEVALSNPSLEPGARKRYVKVKRKLEEDAMLWQTAAVQKRGPEWVGGQSAQDAQSCQAENAEPANEDVCWPAEEKSDMTRPTVPRKRLIRFMKRKGEGYDIAESRRSPLD